MPPAAAADKLLDMLARGRRELALANIFREQVGVAEVAHRDGADRFEAFGDLVCLTRLLRAEAGHRWRGGYQPDGTSADHSDQAGQRMVAHCRLLLSM